MSFVDKLAAVATKVGAAVEEYYQPAVDIAKSVVDLIESAKEVVHETDVDKLTAMQEDLETKVLAHADKTEATLRGQE